MARDRFLPFLENEAPRHPTRRTRSSHLACEAMFYVLYHGQAEPVWFDTVEEAITYISAENVGRGLPPVTCVTPTNLSLLCFVQDRSSEERRVGKGGGW